MEETPSKRFYENKENKITLDLAYVAGVRMVSQPKATHFKLRVIMTSGRVVEMDIHNEKDSNTIYEELSKQLKEYML